ncbi:MAG: hypothetical protein IT159_07055 [Bryobacterales bacterium]|nr:hypothetical protein [Bryobacterales bacterium]
MVIRGVGYAPLPLGGLPGNPVAACVYARDLPLIRALGANAVRTYARIEKGREDFLALLETTGLYWLSGFPLEEYYDPSRTLASRKTEILSAFRDYALRFKGERRLIGYVFGEDVTQNYRGKFSGHPAEFHDLLADAAKVLEEIDPGDAALLTTSTSEIAQLSGSPSGLSFWLWNAGPRSSLRLALDEIHRLSPLPVLVGGYAVDAAIGPEVQARGVTDLTRQILNDPALLGAVYAAYLDDYRSAQQYGLMQPLASELEGLDQVVPRPGYYALAELWGGRARPEAQAPAAPVLEGVTHAATGDEVVAPGALMRLAGEQLHRDEFLANGIPWPLHMGETCLCVGGRPVPLGSITADGGTAWLPWDLETGDHAALLFRDGTASTPATAKVRPYAPGIFPGAVIRAGSLCRATAENGVRPGEVFEVYATGLGPGAPSWMPPSVSINGLPAEVLYSGTLDSLVGLNQVNLRVHPQTPPAKRSDLELRVGEAVTRYPVGVSGPEDRFGIALAGSPAEVVVQAGGPAAIQQVWLEGRNGYCGPVLLSAEGPAGVTIRAPVGMTDQSVPVEIRAAPSVPPQSGSEVSLRGHAPGVIAGAATLRLTVLAGLGDIRVRVVSGGFTALPLARFDWNGRTLYSTAGGGAGRGINVLVVDAATGVFAPVRSFDTWGDETAAARLVAFLDGLPRGVLAMFAVADDGSHLLSTPARTAIASHFGSRSIHSLAYRQSWAMIARKGAATPIDEGLSSDLRVALERTLTFPLP